MKVLGGDRSPYVRKVRIVLEEKALAYEYVQARGSVPNSPVPAYNPLAKIPVLVTDEGKAIYDSPVIVDYLDARFPQPRLIPVELEQRVDVKRWEALGDGIADATVLASHDYEKVQSADWHARQRLKITRGLAVMAKDLGARTYCYGSAFSLADIATGYALAYLDVSLPDIDWRAAHPNLVQLAQRLAERPSFRKTIQQS
jgi:glutathione S-transferase